MPWFRTPNRTLDSAPFDAGDRARLRALIAEMIAPTNFFVARSLQLRWQHVEEETIRWEIYHGRLLDVKHTREMRRFESWGVYLEDNGQLAAESILAIKLDIDEPTLHVVRGLLSYVWEGHDVGGSVIESRETTRWLRELVGSVRLAEFSAWSEVADELTCLLWQAVVGTSRLPLTSLETPLPAFALGQLAYVHPVDAGGPSWQALPGRLCNLDLSVRERVKILEWLLRHVPPQGIASLSLLVVESGILPSMLLSLLRQVFNDVSLSPYANFVDNALDFVQALADQGHIGRDKQVDFLAYLLRLQSRHLAAYDLFTFHHRGANYPDALLLDAVLGRCLRLIDQEPEAWEGPSAAGRRRRMAFCHACLLRSIYQDHPVPDLPTSPGENQRVLPAPFERVPEEQILNPLRRQRKLYLDRPLREMLSPTTRRILRQGLEDMSEDGNSHDLGRAVFIDRPFGDGKHPLEPDQTPLLAHELYSPSVAQRRGHDLKRFAAELQLDFAVPSLPEWNAPGVAVALAAEQNRPVPSLADARRVAEDFRVLRTLPRGISRLLLLLEEWAPAIHGRIGFLREGGVLLRTQPGCVAAFDRHGDRRIELAFDSRLGFKRRAGMEFPGQMSILR